MIKLGVEARDLITGFKGTVTGTCQYLTGCNQALLSPKVKEDGTRPSPGWFDEQRLEVTNKEVVKLNPASGPGHYIEAPIR